MTQNKSASSKGTFTNINRGQGTVTSTLEIATDDADHFSKTSKAQISNINSKFLVLFP